MENGQPALAAAARFISVEDGFNIKRPELAPHCFDAERARALEAPTSTGVVPLDRSDLLLTPYPATSPLLLASFVCIRAGDAMTTRPKASGEIYYVVRGDGRTIQEGRTLAWGPGDIFCLPGGVDVTHRADGDCVLFSVTDEPMLAFAKVRPERPADAPIGIVHYPASMIAAELQALCERHLDADTAGRALFLTSRKMETERTCLPSLTLTLNAVKPGEAQRPHKHNAAAIVFIIKGGSCHSTIGDRSFAWREHSVLLTPPNAVHAHRNTGDKTAVSLIVQDGGLHYHCRTMGFEFA